MQPVLGARRIDGPDRARAIIDIRIPNALALFAERGCAEAPGCPALGIVILRGASGGESLGRLVGLSGGVAMQEVDPNDGHVGAVGDAAREKRGGQGIAALHARLAGRREQGDHPRTLGGCVELLLKGFDGF